MAAASGQDVAAAAQGGLEPVRIYAGVNRPIELALPTDPQPDGATVEIMLLDARSGRLLERVPIEPEVQRVDLARLFPVLWTTRDPSVKVAQLAIAGRPVGAGVILQPMIEPEHTRSALLGLIERSIQAGRFDVLRDVA